jgi:hypothetical protein
MGGNRFIIQAQRLLNVNRGEIISLAREIRNWENKNSQDRLRIINEIQNEFSRLGFSSDLEVFFKPLRKSLSKEIVKTAENKKDFLKKLLVSFGISAAAAAILSKIVVPKVETPQNRTIGYLNEQTDEKKSANENILEESFSSSSISGIAWGLGAKCAPDEKKGKRWTRRYIFIRHRV